MNRISEIIKEKYIARHTKQQKKNFREFIVSELAKDGITAHIQSGKSTGIPVHNIIIGDIEKAKYLITAHYDTPNTSLFPIIMFADSFLFSFLGQLMAMFPIFMLTALASVMTVKYDLNPAINLIVLYGAMFLSMFAFTNKNNFNDNTSGVVTVLEVLYSLTEEERKDCAFVLFDNEEKGLLGSAYLYKSMKNKNITVLNIDCIGDGDDIRLFCKGKAMTTGERLSSFAGGEKSVKVVKRTFRNILYMSDDYNFPKGICFASFRICPLGKYISRIHTNRDTVLNEENVSVVSGMIAGFIKQA